MRKELWNGYSIRFVKLQNEWWAVAKDVSEALGYPETNAMTKRLDKRDLMSDKLSDMNMLSTLINEFGIYEAVFGSKKKEAKDFKRWIYQTIKELRQATGLQGYEIFRMLDKEHQKEAMNKIKTSMNEPTKKDFIKANTIANKAVSTMHGFNKMVKKSDMTPKMLIDREVILDETVQLMTMKEKYGLQLSVSEKIYNHSSESQIA